MPDKKKIGDEEDIDPDLLDAAVADDEEDDLDDDEDVIPGLLGDEEEETL